MATQSFLPLLSIDNRILGSIPIAGHTFSGNETTFDVNGTPRPLRKLLINMVDSSSSPGTTFVMGIPVSRVDEALGVYTGYSPSFMPVQDTFPLYSWSNLAISAPIQIVSMGSMFNFFLGERSSAEAPPNPTPGPTMNPTSLSWSCTVAWDNAPSCAYFDFDWLPLYGAAVTPTTFLRVASSPPGGMLKAFVVSSPQPINPGSILPRYGTVRILKTVQNPLAAGDYTFVFEIVDEPTVLAEATFTLTLTE